jgi:hypothetical protein
MQTRYQSQQQKFHHEKEILGQQLCFNIQIWQMNDKKYRQKLKIDEENQEQKMTQKLDLENQKHRFQGQR